MARFWKPSPVWKDHPCYVVGGGPSLETFDWNVLRDVAVIGCNAACYFDPSIAEVVLFGDGSFLAKHRAALDKYVELGGLVVTLSSTFHKRDSGPEWLKVMRKVNHGMGTDRLGWNGNTGAAAINLALLMGANPIYLLGFDMQLSQNGKANFHNAYNNRPNPKAYSRFLKGMADVRKDLAKLFPDRRVINLEDGTSALNEFPKESLKEHFSTAAVGFNGLRTGAI